MCSLHPRCRGLTQALMGFTLRSVREAFDSGVLERIEELQSPDRIGLTSGHELLEALHDNERRVLSTLSFDGWLEAFEFICQRELEPGWRTWWDTDGEHAALPENVRFLLGGDIDGNIWFPSYDFRVFIRAAVEVTGTELQVTYDLTELAEVESVTDDSDLCEWARRETAEDFSSIHKIVVLTEGSSDSFAIQGAVKVLYPHIAEYYSFMDFEAVRAAGGAGHLVAMVKAFAGAGIANRIVALFDNDTAARSAVRGLRDVRLPDNVRVIHYPTLDLAREYPTLRAAGHHDHGCQRTRGLVGVILRPRHSGVGGRDPHARPMERLRRHAQRVPGRTYAQKRFACAIQRETDSMPR
jgi:hypothetical protein